jgi:hypothetical protein
MIDMFLGPALKDEVLNIMPVQKQTRKFKLICEEVQVRSGQQD